MARLGPVRQVATWSQGGPARPPVPCHVGRVGGPVTRPLFKGGRRAVLREGLPFSLGGHCVNTFFRTFFFFFFGFSASPSPPASSSSTVTSPPPDLPRPSTICMSDSDERLERAKRLGRDLTRTRLTSIRRGLNHQPHADGHWDKILSQTKPLLEAPRQLNICLSATQVTCPRRSFAAAARRTRTRPRASSNVQLQS